jgi:hypothetical protein
MILLLSFIALPCANAGVIFFNGGPNTDGGYPLGGVIGWTADDFLIPSGGTVASVGFYFKNNSSSGWDQSLSYAIIANSSGPFGSVLASGAPLNLTQEDSGLPWCCGGNALLVTFDLQSPFSAGAGVRYWLQLSGAGDQSWWVTADANGTPTAWYGGAPTRVQMAFYLNDDASTGGDVPEPASMLLTGVGALALLLFRRRK